MSIYLEISPRMSGKTHRLVTAVCKHLAESEGNTVSLVSNDGVRSLIYEFNKRLNKDVSTRIERLPKFGSPTHRNFYDEFYYTQGLTEVDPNGYYCTSIDEKIKFNLFKESFLHKLLSETEGAYLSYCPLFMDESGAKFVFQEEFSKEKFLPDFLTFK